MAKLARIVSSTVKHLPGSRGGHDKSIAEEIKELRNALGMTQRQFAETFGLALSNVQTWESNAKNGNPDLASRLLIDMIKVDHKAVAALVRKTKMERLRAEEMEPA